MIRTKSSDKPFDITEVNLRLSVGGVPLDDVDLSLASEAEREALRRMVLSAAVDQIERTFRPRVETRTVIS